MPRYDDIFDALGERAVRQGVVDAETTVRLWAAANVSEAEIFARLLEDLDGGGSIFGKFFRSMADAASAATMVAVRQGELVGGISEDETLQRFLDTQGIDGSVIDAAISGADPEIAGEIEDAVAELLEETWIAEVNAPGSNVCHRCLPLHGTSRTREEWRAAGLLPETIHAGWTSHCHCRLVPTKLAEGRADLLAPLRRVRIEKGSKRTARAVLQEDLERSIAARNKALESEDGRRTLRRLGQAGRMDGVDA